MKIYNIIHDLLGSLKLMNDKVVVDWIKYFYHNITTSQGCGSHIAFYVRIEKDTQIAHVV